MSLGVSSPWQDRSVHTEVVVLTMYLSIAVGTVLRCTYLSACLFFSVRTKSPKSPRALRSCSPPRDPARLRRSQPPSARSLVRSLSAPLLCHPQAMVVTCRHSAISIPGFVAFAVVAACIPGTLAPSRPPPAGRVRACVEEALPGFRVVSQIWLGRSDGSDGARSQRRRPQKPNAMVVPERAGAAEYCEHGRAALSRACRY